MAITPIYEYQYDIGLDGIKSASGTDEYYDEIFDLDREDMNKYGHMEYILIIYETGSLPESNAYELYHPPLNYIISAGFLHVLDLFNASSKFKIEALEFIPVVYSVLVLIICYKIMRELGFSKKQIILPLSMLSFGSIFLFMSKMVNNDELLTVFSMASILYLIKWYKNPSYKNTIILALLIGLGGMTKTSIIVMALPLIFTYIRKIIRLKKEGKKIKKIVIEGVIFTAISIPLLFWYQIRNAAKFGQEAFSVLTANPELAVANTGFASRWILNSEIFENMLNLTASNVWAYVINSSLFFVMNYDMIPVWISIIFKVISIILIVISIIGIVKYVVKGIATTIKKEEYSQRDNIYILAVTYLAWMIGFIGFNISLPYSCTMHVRYIVVPMMIGIMFISMIHQQAKLYATPNLINGLVILYNFISVAVVFYSTVFYFTSYTMIYF